MALGHSIYLALRSSNLGQHSHKRPDQVKETDYCKVTREAGEKCEMARSLKVDEDPARVLTLSNSILARLSCHESYRSL